MNPGGKGQLEDLAIRRRPRHDLFTADQIGISDELAINQHSTGLGFKKPQIVSEPA
jgi:hypothetical protein